MTGRRTIAPALALGVVLGGCGSGNDAAVRRTADDFWNAVATGDNSAACELLTVAARDELQTSEERTCAAALDAVELVAPNSSSAVTVASGQAQVRYTDGAAVYLSREAAVWRIMAAGCVPSERDRYSCQVSGG